MSSPLSPRSSISNSPSYDSFSSSSSPSRADSNETTKLEIKVSKLEKTVDMLDHEVSDLTKEVRDLIERNAELMNALTSEKKGTKRKKIESINNNNNNNVSQSVTSASSTKKVKTAHRSTLLEKNELYKMYPGLRKAFEKTDENGNPIEKMFLFTVPTKGQTLYYAIPVRLVENNFAFTSEDNNNDLSYTLKKNQNAYFDPDAVKYVLLNALNSDPELKKLIDFQPLSSSSVNKTIFEDVLLLGQILQSENIKKDCAQYMTLAIQTDRKNIVRFFDPAFSHNSCQLQKAWFEGVLTYKGLSKTRKGILSNLKKVVNSHLEKPPFAASLPALALFSCVKKIPEITEDSCEMILKLSSVSSKNFNLYAIYGLIDLGNKFWPKLYQAKVLLTKNDYETAGPILEELSKTASDSEKWWVLLLTAQLQFEQHQVEQALGTLSLFNIQHGLKEDQPLVYKHALLYRAQIYKNQGNLENALEDIQKVLDLDPENPEALLERAEILLQKSQETEALADLKKVLNFGKEWSDAIQSQEIFDLTWENNARALDLMMTIQQKRNNWEEFNQWIDILKARFDDKDLNGSNSLVAWALAKAAYYKKDYKKAHKEFSNLAPYRMIARWGRASSSHALYDFTDASADFLTLKCNHFWNSSIHLEYVSTLFNMQRFQDALKEINDLLQYVEADKREEALILRCRLLIELNEGTPLEALNAILEKNPKSIKALRVRSSYKLNHDQLEEAEADMIQALNLDPQNVLSIAGLAQICLKRKNYDLAKKYCDNAIALDPQHYYAYKILGQCYKEQGKIKEAFNHLTKVLEIYPHNSSALRLIFDIYNETNDIPHLIAFCEDRINKKLGNTLTLETLVKAYLKTKQYDKALKNCNLALKYDSDKAELYVLRGQTLSKLEKEAEARADFDKAITLKPDDLTPLQEKWAFNQEWAQWDNCIKDGLSIIEKDPDNASGAYFLAYAFNKKNEHQAALKYMQAAVAKQPPKTAFPFLVCGNVYLSEKDDEAAEEAFNNAYHLDQQNEEVAVNIAGLAYKKKEYDKCIDFFTKAIAINPKNPYSFTSRGDLYIRKNETRMAWSDFHTALALNPNNVDAHIRIAEIYYNSGSNDAALQAANKALSFNQHAERALLIRALVYFAKKQYKEAYADFKAILNNNPNHLQAQSYIKTIEQYPIS